MILIAIYIFSCWFVQTTPVTATVSTTVESLPSGSEQRNVILGENSPGYTAEGEIISTQTVSSKTRTVETITVSQRRQQTRTTFGT